MGRQKFNWSEPRKDRTARASTAYLPRALRRSDVPEWLTQRVTLDEWRAIESKYRYSVSEAELYETTIVSRTDSDIEVAEETFRYRASFIVNAAFGISNELGTRVQMACNDWVEKSKAALLYWHNAHWTIEVNPLQPHITKDEWCLILVHTTYQFDFTDDDWVKMSLSARADVVLSAARDLTVKYPKLGKIDFYQRVRKAIEDVTLQSDSVIGSDPGQAV